MLRNGPDAAKHLSAGDAASSSAAGDAQRVWDRQPDAETLDSEAQPAWTPRLQVNLELGNTLLDETERTMAGFARWFQTRAPARKC